LFIKNNGEFHNSIIYNLKKVCLKKLSKINNKPEYEELMNLLELGLIPLLLVSLMLPLTRSVEYAFTIDASSPFYF
jgi:hypothetical protein